MQIFFNWKNLENDDYEKGFYFEQAFCQFFDSNLAYK
jgi:hypothetical protein